MPDLFPVIEIEPEWVLEPEALGSKKKFWYRETQKHPDWLFKYPQQNTGQHWSEKIAAEIAFCMDIPHARVELAIFQGERGSITESFVQDGQILFHGNQILAGQVVGYNPDAKYKQSDHTLENVFLALNERARGGRALFSNYLVLDAVIGNTDRHHENWGILLEWTQMTWEEEGEVWIVGLAPSFDHASSLGRELLDGGRKQSRQKILDEKQVGLYAEQASGAIYWDKMDKKGISPLELVRRARVKYPEIFDAAIRRVERLDRSVLEKIVSRVPDDWMTPLMRRFSIELVCYNLGQLGRML